jgi:hypothetical protein
VRYENRLNAKQTDLVDWVCLCYGQMVRGLQKFHSRFYWLRHSSQLTMEIEGNSRLTLPFLRVVVVSNFDHKHGQDTNSL